MWGIPGTCLPLMQCRVHQKTAVEMGDGLQVVSGGGIFDMEVCWFSREEHRKHSPGCAFLTVKKQVEELTVSEFLKLDKQRAKNKIVCMTESKD